VPPLDSRSGSGSSARRFSCMVTNISWHGTQEESLALLAAIAHNCTCEFGLMGVRSSLCGPHQMLRQDQRALNGLLFSRRMARRLLEEEFLTPRQTGFES
jgi:hypothetical protein